MKHDFRQQASGTSVDRFCSWLEHETVESLRRSNGDEDATKASIFLFVNRAYEAHMPESQIGRIFGTCLARAGFPESEDELAFEWLEQLAEVAAKVHEQST